MRIEHDACSPVLALFLHRIGIAPEQAILSPVLDPRWRVPFERVRFWQDMGPGLLFRLGEEL